MASISPPARSEVRYGANYQVSSIEASGSSRPVLDLLNIELAYPSSYAHMSLEISVVLVCFDRGRFLRERIDSILTRTFTDFELIICDDCSTDDTPEIWREYARRDKKSNSSRDGFRRQFNKDIGLFDPKYRFLLRTSIYGLVSPSDTTSATSESH